MRFLVSSEVLSLAVLLVCKCVLGSARMSRWKNTAQGKGHHDESLTCFTAFNKCTRSDQCSAALKGLDKKCKVISGSCGAEMVDLPRCGQIMDHIFSYGFPESRCSCPEGSDDCQSVLDKIYSNPCFVSIRHLRKVNLFPKQIDAYDKAKEYDITTTPPVEVTTSLIVKSGEFSNRVEGKFTLFKEVFGDRKQNVDEPSTVKTKMVSFTDNNKILRPTEAKRRIRIKSRKDVTYPESKAKQTTKQPKDAKDNDNWLIPSTENRGRVAAQTHKSLKKHSKETYEKERKSNNDADYKSIAIILGVLLGFFILSSIILFLWTRSHGSFFYTNGKFVQNHRVDEGVHCKSQTKFCANNFPSMHQKIQV